MLRALLLFVLLAAPPLAWAESAALQPPCGLPVQPPFAAVDQTPSIGVWTAAVLRKTAWRPAACLNWGPGGTRLAAALAADFRFSGSVDDLLVRFGALSTYKSIRYWSVTQKRWRELVFDAGVVDGPDGLARPDLTAADFVVGRDFYYFETDRMGRAVYRLTVRERTADRIVLATENVTPIRVVFLTAFDPGALQSVIFLERHGSGIWGYYQVIRAGEGASSVTLGSDSSYVNRLAALFRYVARIPTDREPPAAP